MKTLAAFLLALAVNATAQTYRTVTADTNNVIRTNFSIGQSNVTGLIVALDSKLATNGTLPGANITGTVANASNVTQIVPLNLGGTGAANASNARAALELGTAATNAASAFQPASATLSNLAAGNGSSLTNVSGASNPVGNGGALTNLAASNIVGVISLTNGGIGGTNLVSARSSLLPAYTSNSGKVLAVNTNENDVEWIAAGGGGGGGVTSVNVSGGLTGLTFSGGPITSTGTITMAGMLDIAYGGTGGNTAELAMSNLGFWNQNKVVLTTSTTNVGAGSVAIGTNAKAQGPNTVAIGPSSSVFTNSGGVAIGQSSSVATANGTGVAIGFSSYAEAGVAIGNNAETQRYPSTNTNVWGVAIGRNPVAYNNGVAIGKDAIAYEGGGAVGLQTVAERGFAGGELAQAYSANNIQLGTGENYDNWTIQIFNSGTVDTNEWARIAALSTYPTTNIQVTVVGGATNTLVFSNGILTSVTSP